MHKFSFYLSLVLLTISLGSHAEVYKWVDEKGQVHFGDRPSNGSSAEKVKIKSSNTSSIPADRREKRDKLLNVMEEERAEKKQAELTRAEEKKLRKERCQAAQDRLSEYQNAGYLYQLNDEGEEVILDDDTHQKAMDDARDEVRAWCG